MSTVPKLAFVATAEQGDRILEYARPADGVLLACADLNLFSRLASKGHQVVDLFTYLDPETIERNAHAGFELCDAMGTTLAGRLIHRGCDLSSLARYDLVTSFQAALNAEVMVRRALDAFDPCEVACFGERKEALLWDSPSPPPDVFNAVVAICCKERLCQMQVLHCPVERPHGTVQVDAPRSVLLPEGPIDVLLFGETFTLKEMELLLRDARSNGRRDWLLVSDSFRDVGIPQLPISVLRELPFVRDGVRDRALSLKNEGLASGWSRGVPGASIVEHPSLRFIFDAYLWVLAAAARYVTMGEFLAETLLPRVVVTGYDNQARYRCFQYPFLERNIPVISVDHVGMSMPLSAMRNRGAISHVATWGEHDAAAQRKWRPAGIAFPVGSLRADMAAIRQRSCEPIAEVSGNPVPRVVLLTSRQTSLWSSLIDTNLWRESWEALRSMFMRHPNWRFEIKAHPRYDYPDFYSTEILSGLDNVHFVEGNASAVLSKATVAVLVNNHSTVAVEAAGMDVPVILLCDGI